MVWPYGAMVKVKEDFPSSPSNLPATSDEWVRDWEEDSEWESLFHPFHSLNHSFHLLLATLIIISIPFFLSSSPSQKKVAVNTSCGEPKDNKLVGNIFLYIRSSNKKWRQRRRITSQDLWMKRGIEMIESERRDRDDWRWDKLRKWWRWSKMMIQERMFLWNRIFCFSPSNSQHVTFKTYSVD